MEHVLIIGSILFVESELNCEISVVIHWRCLASCSRGVFNVGFCENTRLDEEAEGRVAHINFSTLIVEWEEVFASDFEKSASFFRSNLGVD